MAGINLEPHPIEWHQGEDLTISLIYKTTSSFEGEEPTEPTPVDLTGYTVRMDISTLDYQRLYTFNSDVITDVDPETEGDVEDAEIDATLGGPTGEIKINIPREITLPDGPLFTFLDANPPVTTFTYDVFLRDPDDNQKKILRGSISIEKSVTLWK